MSSTLESTARCIRIRYLNNKTLNSNEYQRFKKRYPKLYNMLIQPDMSDSMLNKLFETLPRDDTSDEIFDSSKKFSEFGASMFLYPQFGTPTESDLRIAEKNIKKKIQTFT